MKNTFKNIALATAITIGFAGISTESRATESASLGVVDKFKEIGSEIVLPLAKTLIQAKINTVIQANSGQACGNIANPPIGDLKAKAEANSKCKVNLPVLGLTNVCSTALNGLSSLKDVLVLLGIGVPLTDDQVEKIGKYCPLQDIKDIGTNLNAFEFPGVIGAKSGFKKSFCSRSDIAKTLCTDDAEAAAACGQECAPPPAN